MEQLKQKNQNTANTTFRISKDGSPIKSQLNSVLTKFYGYNNISSTDLATCCDVTVLNEWEGGEKNYLN
jgi:hypothetical protein